MKASVAKKNAFLFSEDGILLDSAKIASSKAVRSAIALGMTIKVIRGRKIMALYPDQSTKVLRELVKSSLDLSSLKKGMILERK